MGSEMCIRDSDISLQIEKNSSKKISWREKVASSMSSLNSIGLKCGVYVLWGLGESQVDRMNQLIDLKHCNKVCNNPVAVGLNWAVVHPLKNKNTQTYLDWGTSSDSKYISYLPELFGESSENYCFPNVTLPSLEEMDVLKKMYKDLLNSLENSMTHYTKNEQLGSLSIDTAL